MQTAVNVISKNGKRLMPTFRFGKVRHLLKSGKAVIVNHEPFTIQLTYETTEYVQEIEICVDAGYQHIGVSVKSEKAEYVSQQYDLLKDEKKRHDDCRANRRTRRNRLRYRAPRFNNRNKPEGWFAPSIQNKYEVHLNIIDRFMKVMPITRIVIETAQFDIQVLDAIEHGLPIPEGEGYQRGERYGIETLREAVFMRDHHTCQICKKGLNDGKILRVHHALFWKGRHADRLSELITVCTDCHTPANHQPSGKLWGITLKRSGNYSAESFMNIVRKKLYFTLRDRYQEAQVFSTDGVSTKCSRHDLKIDKSHVNDAFAMGWFHPKIRTEPEYYSKRRRNNRVLEKFYDAKVIDIRTGKKVTGKDLGCERTNRKEKRNSEKSLRKYRGQKITKGRRFIRRNRYEYQPGTVVLIDNKKRIVTACHCNGASNQIQTKGLEPKDVSVKKCKILIYSNGWKRITK